MFLIAGVGGLALQFVLLVVDEAIRVDKKVAATARTDKTGKIPPLEAMGNNSRDILLDFELNLYGVCGSYRTPHLSHRNWELVSGME